MRRHDNQTRVIGVAVRPADKLISRSRISIQVKVCSFKEGKAEHTGQTETLQRRRDIIDLVFGRVIQDTQIFAAYRTPLYTRVVQTKVRCLVCFVGSLITRPGTFTYAGVNVQVRSVNDQRRSNTCQQHCGFEIVFTPVRGVLEVERQVHMSGYGKRFAKVRRIHILRHYGQTMVGCSGKGHTIRADNSYTNDIVCRGASCLNLMVAHTHC